MNDPHSRRWDLETIWVAAAATAVSITTFLIYYRAGDILRYGDAVAHINIARRVFDSRTPGLLQLGTVWLPLPHLLTIPFITNRWMWQTGVGGSVPSMISYVLGVVGIFRLVRSLLASISIPARSIRIVALTAAALYGLNPNLLYMQATAMSEPLYLTLFIWCTVHLQEFLSATHGKPSTADFRSARSLWKSGLCAAGASLTRYDGWFLAMVLGLILVVLWIREGRPAQVLALLAQFALLLAAGPVLWLAYNAIVYRNPLEFANGPYSAKAIERTTSLPGSTPHPGAGSIPLAGLYFVKCAEINVAEGGLGALWVVGALGGSLVLAIRRNRMVTSALLWSPVAFYALSVAYGGVPIFMPAWYPFSAYNVRYGLQLLPAFAVFLPVAGLILVERVPAASLKRIIGFAMAVLLCASYITIWRAQPVCYREAWINSRSRLVLEMLLAAQISKLPPESSFLMYLGGHVGALQQAGIPLRRSINEGNHRVWMQPSDPDGLWERSLAQPTQYADYVVAIDDDPVALAMRRHSLPVVARIDVPGQPSATVYRAR